MKSTDLAFAAIIAITCAAWATPAPITLTHDQLIDIVQRADGNPHTIPGSVGAHLGIDLRPAAVSPYFVAAGNSHGPVFTCENGFEDFAGGPITATMIGYERGEDARDFVKLSGCTPQERQK